MKLKHLTSAALIAGSLFSTSTWASAYITLDPAANNGGAGTLDSGTSSFTTNNSQINFSSLLDINSTPGTAGITNFSESGNFQILNFNPTPNSTSNVTQTYNIYGTLSFSGSGTWVTPSDYVVVSFAPGGGTAVYGSPGCTTSGSHSGTSCASSSGLTFNAPGSVGASGITPGNHDFLLGNATLASTTANGASALLGTGNTASENIQALLGFTPAPGTTGAGGFWEAPSPFVLSIGAQAGSDTLGTTYSVTGGQTLVTVANVNGVDQGGGSLNYSVPEPASLALVGLGLLGMGVVSSRRRYKS